MGFLGGGLDPLGGDSLGSDIGGPFPDEGSAALSAVNNLQQFVEEIVSSLTSIFNTLGKFLLLLWTGFFKGILQRIKDALSALHKWLEDHLRPIINFLKRIRALQQAYFNTYLRPILVMLQHIRQYLQILSLLHIQLATQLDNFIAGIQARLVQQFTTLTATINTAIDLLNVLSDPNALLRKPVLLLSIRRQLPALIRAVTGKPPGYWFPSPPGRGGGAFAPVSSNFNPADPSQNPPASSYIGNDDGITGFAGFALGFAPADTSVDDAGPLDYFNNSLYPAPLCGDPAHCLNQAIQLLVPAVPNG